MQYADSQIASGLKNLMNQARSKFQLTMVDMADYVDEENINRIFEECVKDVPGAQEAFEIWNKLFDSAEIN